MKNNVIIQTIEMNKAFDNLGGKDFVYDTLQMICPDIFTCGSRFAGYNEIQIISQYGVFEKRCTLGDFKDKEKTEAYFHNNLQMIKELLKSCKDICYNFIAKKLNTSKTMVTAVMREKTQNFDIIKEIINYTLIIFCSDIYTMVNVLITGGNKNV